MFVRRPNKNVHSDISFNSSQNFWMGCSPAALMNKLPLYETHSLLRSWRYLSW